MITEKRTEIICMTLTMLFFLIVSASAEGEWAANGDNIHNTNSGNVGIGTTDPKQALDIDGNLELNGSLIGGVSSARAYYNLLAARWGGAQTGALIIQTNVRQDDHTMTQTKVILKRKYSSGNTNCEYLISGYWSTEANGGFQGRGYQADCNDIQRIRFMRNNTTGNVAFVIGETTTAWSHPMVVVPEFLAHYGIASDDYAKGWKASIVNDLSGYGNSDEVDNTSPIHETSTRIGIGTSDPAEKLDVKDGRLKTNMALSSDQDHHQLANDAGTIFGKIGLKYSSADFYIGTDTYPNLILLDRSTGNVGIGTMNPQSKLAVNGTITANEIKVESGWSDFVFDENYDLASLEKVESFIRENKHLPDTPSAKEVEQQGLAVSEMLAKQMQKIEEMTLYLIQLKKENDQLKERIALLEKTNKATAKY